MRRPLLRSLPIVLAALLAPWPAEAALVLADPSRLIWDFTLVRTGNGTGAGDQFAIQYGPDRLDAGESLLVEVFGSGQSVPVFSRTFNGPPGGVDGFFYFSLDWDNAFPTLGGSVTMDILTGTVEIERSTIIVSTPGNHYVISTSPNIRLVPEPGVAVMLLSASMLSFRRRRSHQDSRCFLPQPSRISKGS